MLLIWTKLPFYCKALKAKAGCFLSFITGIKLTYLAHTWRKAFDLALGLCCFPQYTFVDWDTRTDSRPVIPWSGYCHHCKKKKRKLKQTGNNFKKDRKRNLDRDRLNSIV